MDAGECAFEDGFLLWHFQTLQDYAPVLIESIVEEFSLEAECHGTDEVDTLHLHSMQTQMQV